MIIRSFLMLLIAIFLVGASPTLTCAEPAASPADATVREGVDLLKQKQWQAAVETLKKAVQQDPKNVNAHVFLGMAYAFVNNSAEARKELDIALRLDPENKRAKDLLATLDRIEKAYMTSNPQSLDHFNKAEAFFREGQYKEAIPEYEASAAADPKFAKPWVYLGDAYMALHDYPRAIESYKKAIAVDATDPQPWHFMGDVYEHQYDQGHDVKSLDLAIEAYQQALKLDPKYQAASAKLARAQQKRAALPK